MPSRTTAYPLREKHRRELRRMDEFHAELHVEVLERWGRWRGVADSAWVGLISFGDYESNNETEKVTIYGIGIWTVEPVAGIIPLPYRLEELYGIETYSFILLHP